VRGRLVRRQRVAAGTDDAGVARLRVEAGDDAFDVGFEVDAGEFLELAAGVVLIILGGAGTDSVLAGAGVALILAGVVVWMINWMYRMSVQSNRDREREELAREYFDRHGRWPDED